eukprot:c23591_g1_i1 orf=264-2249(+)
MQRECRIRRTAADDITRLLKVYAHAGDLDKTKHVHSHFVEFGSEVSLQVSSALVHTYIRCGSLENSCSVFDNVRQRDVILWTTLITGYAQFGLSAEAFMLFRRMHMEGEVPNNFTYASILKASTGMLNRGMAEQVHTSLIEAGFDSDVTIGNVLVDVYAKLGSMERALLVFNNMHKKDIVSWSAMISCFSQYERWREAISLFEEMHQEQLQPNNYTYVSILKACASLKTLENCRLVHSGVVERSWEVDVYVRSTLVDTYVKCGCIEDARGVFDKILELDLVSMNAMLSGYAQNALGEEALSLFQRLQNECVMPDKVTFAIILKACASVAAIEEGNQVHARISDAGIARDLFMGSTLVDMYVKCKQVDEARQVFDGMFERDVVLWNCLLVGYQEDNSEEAMHLFNQMQHEGVFADAVTFVIMLKACIGIAALVWGKQAHAHLVNSSLESNMYVRSSLLDMYAKCGSLEGARRVFDSTREWDVIAWNSMITAYAQRGHNKEVFTLFQLMQKEGLEPSGVTLGCVLSACRHAGLVEDGCEYFKSLSVTYRIKPSREHFGCIVDLFARVGLLDEAADFLSKLPLEPTVEPWMALLGACKVHGNVDVGECAFEHIERFEPGHVGAIILLSNVYAAAKKWNAVHATRLKLCTGAMHEEPEQQHELCG